MLIKRSKVTNIIRMDIKFQHNMRHGHVHLSDHMGFGLGHRHLFRRYARGAFLLFGGLPRGRCDGAARAGLLRPCGRAALPAEQDRVKPKKKHG